MHSQDSPSLQSWQVSDGSASMDGASGSGAAAGVGCGAGVGAGAEGADAGVSEAFSGATKPSFSKNDRKALAISKDVKNNRHILPVSGCHVEQDVNPRISKAPQFR